MDILSLRYFLAIAREENITKASYTLHVTQPTLSRQIMQLEDELGVKLFERESHRIRLTEEGMLLRRRAHEILELVEKTKTEFQNDSDLQGELSFGMGELLGIDHVSEIIKDFMQKYPNVTLKYYTGVTSDIKEKIEMGLLDLGLLFEASDLQKYETFKIDETELYGVYVPNDSFLAQYEEISIDDIRNETLFLPEKVERVYNLKQFIDKYHDTLSIRLRFNLMYNALALTKKNLGLTIGIKLRATYDGVKFIPFKENITGSTVLVWKKGQFSNKLVTEFVNFVKSYAKSI